MPAGKMILVHKPKKRRRRGARIGKKLEKRIRQIAKKEATKARDKNEKSYFVGSYFGRGAVAATQDLTDDWTDNLVKLYEVPLYDEDAHQGDQIGKRLSHEVFIRGFRATGQIRMGGSSTMTDAGVRIVLFRQRRPAAPQSTDVVSDLPLYVVYNNLNGSVPDEDQEEVMSKVQILAQKTIWLRPSYKRDISRNFTLSKFWKRPQKQNFDPEDTLGDNPLDYTYWLTAYTNEDFSSGASAVKLVAEVKMFYFNE